MKRLSIKQLALGGATVLGMIGFASPAAFAMSGGGDYNNNSQYNSSYNSYSDHNHHRCNTQHNKYEDYRGMKYTSYKYNNNYNRCHHHKNYNSNYRPSSYSYVW